MVFSNRWWRYLGLLPFLAGVSFAQNEAPGAPGEQTAQPATPPSQQQPKRILGVMPNYRAVSAGEIPPPPTPKQEEFSGDQVRARHILVKTEEEAKQAQERLAKKESFEDLARTLSQDSGTASKGGDLGYFGREQMVPDFAKVAFALKPGEVSGVVKTPFGYHIIQLVDRKKGQPFTYEQVKDQLRRRLVDERQNQRFQEWMKTLESGAKITRDESLLPVGKQTPSAPDAPGAPATDGKGGNKT